MDANQLCPGGTGKKVRHCQCRDILGELGKIADALEGKQRVAALGRINRALATKANRPCLLALKAQALLSLGELQDLEDTVATFIQAAPRNVLAHTYATFLELRKNNVRGAMRSLQQALSIAAGRIPMNCYQAMKSVGRALAVRGDYLSARAHLNLCAVIGPKDDREPTEVLLEVLRMPGVPATLKQPFNLDECPEGVAWSGRYQSAFMLGVTGVWRDALRQLEALDRDVPGQPCVVRSVAVLRGNLADPATADGWRRYATLSSLPFDTAVEAEAVAQTLQLLAHPRLVDIERLTFNVSDASALNEKLLSSRVVSGDADDFGFLQEERAPRPKGLFDLLSCPLPAPKDSLQLDDLPRVRAKLRLFGRETDREARLECIVLRNCRYDRTRAALVELAGEYFMDGGREESLHQVLADSAEFLEELRIPPGVSVLQQESFRTAATRHAIHDHWTVIPLPTLDGKTPEQAAADEAYKTRLTAAVFVLEQFAEIEGWSVDLNVIRAKLGMPTLDPIDMSELGERWIDEINVIHWPRIAVETLTNDHLSQFLTNVSILGMRSLELKVGQEVIRRESTNGVVDKEELCGRLATLAWDSDGALDYLRQARVRAEAGNRSPARWLLNELPLRLARGESAEAQSLFSRLHTHHGREPGVAETLSAIMQQLEGAVRATGNRAASETESLDDEPQQPAQRIWTPGMSESPGEEDSPKKSSLWLPGMD
ncbi:MAG: hypothetical protein FJ276_00575 [Planctomycetes bacterium]|nr:hypothetical protein [Planctomycetota bacterium]